MAHIASIRSARAPASTRCTYQYASRPDGLGGAEHNQGGSAYASHLVRRSLSGRFRIGTILVIS
jgi:hypothetical protein